MSRKPVILTKYRNEFFQCKAAKHLNMNKLDEGMIGVLQLGCQQREMSERGETPFEPIPRPRADLGP